MKTVIVTLSVVLSALFLFLPPATGAGQAPLPPVLDAKAQADALNTQGRAAYDAEKYAAAVPLFQKAVALDPGESAARSEKSHSSPMQKCMAGRLFSRYTTDIKQTLETTLMTASNETETIRVQSLITQTGVRLGTDAAFKSSYQSDPISALTGAGIPRDAVQHILRQVSKFKGEDEVSGYDDYDSTGGYHYTLDNPHNW